MDTDELFVHQRCVECGINIYECTMCFEKFFVRGYHLCVDDERERLLRRLLPRDEGFSESCQKLHDTGVHTGTCSCTRPCRHLDLELV